MKRIIWVDYAKVLAILLVIWGHTMLKIHPTPVPKIIIYSFHMPLFFLLSGFLYKQKDIRNFTKDTIKTLLIPLILFNCLEFIKYINITEFNFLGGGITFIKDFVTAIYHGEPLIGPSWFLLCLIWIRIISFISVHISKSNHLFLFLISIGLVFTNFLSAKIGYLTPNLCIGQAFLSTPFFLIGYLLKENRQIFISFINNKRWVLTIICLWIILGRINGSVSLNGCNFGNNLFLMYLVGLSGSLIIIKLCTLIKQENKLIKTLSMGTLVILCTHGFILNASINKYLIFPIESFCWYLYTFAGSFIILISEYFIIKAFFTKYLNVFVGGRKL